MKKRIAITSLGCNKNTVDSEFMSGALKEEGFSLVESAEEADLVIVNTCGFITAAKEESIEAILNLASINNGTGKPFILVAGCLSQRYGRELMSEMPEIQGVMGTGEVENVVSIVNRVLGGERIIAVSGSGSLCSDYRKRVRLEDSPVAYVKIAEGCNNCCAYCAIPYIRGNYRSRDMESIIEEVRVLAGEGAREIILVAQETTRYGLDLYGDYKLAELLRRLAAIDDVDWIRILYCYPTSITEELIQVMAAEDKICKYIDLPLQHASDHILKRMNRRGSKKEIRNLIHRLRDSIPGLTLRTTFIAGFPGETESDFKELLDFMQEIKFERAGVFAYSQEEGTPAAEFLAQVPEDIKESRVREAMLLQQEISYARNQSKIGYEFTVLVEGWDPEYKMYTGRTRADAPEIDGQVYFFSPAPVETGSMVSILVTRADEYDLTGELVHEFT